MNILIKITSLALVLALVSCKNDAVKPEQDTAPVNESEVTQTEVSPKESEGAAVVGLSCDNQYEINVHFATTAGAGITVDVVKEGKSEIFEMSPVASGSGAKYQSADGHFLWNKGKDYLFGKEETTLCNCSEK